MVTGSYLPSHQLCYRKVRLGLPRKPAPNRDASWEHFYR